LVLNVEEAYWNLCFAREKLRFADESAAIARKLVTDSRERLATGKMSRMQLVEAEAGLAYRLATRADRQQEMLDAVNQLKLLLSVDSIPGDALLLPTTKLFLTSQSISYIDSLRTQGPDSLLDLVQPDILARSRERDKSETLVAYRKNQLLPELNLQGRYGINGQDRTAEGALFRMLEERNRAWSARIELRMPLLLNIEARNRLAAEKVRLRAAEKQLEATRYELRASIDILHRRLRALTERIRQAREVVNFRSRLLQVELARLEAGKSNYRLVYEIEEDLADARQWELESTMRFRVTTTRLSVLSGEILQRRGLETIEEGTPVLADFLGQEPRE
jgi:outer membrane protein TolC